MILAGAMYAMSAALTLRLPQPRARTERRPVGPRGRVPALTCRRIGAVGMRAASGFLLFLVAFALRRGGPRLVVRRPRGLGRGRRVPRRPRGAPVPAHAFARRRWSSPACWRGRPGRERGVRVVHAGGAGGVRGRRRGRDRVRPARVPEPDAARTRRRERSGRVFVRYEVLFQLAWVAGAFLPARAADRLPYGHPDPRGLLRCAPRRARGQVRMLPRRPASRSGPRRRCRRLGTRPRRPGRGRRRWRSS